MLIVFLVLLDVVEAKGQDLNNHFKKDFRPVFFFVFCFHVFIFLICYILHCRFLVHCVLTIIALQFSESVFGSSIGAIAGI